MAHKKPIFMKNKAVIGVTLVGIIIGGLAYWFQAYGQMTVLGIHMWLIMSIGAFLGSLLLMLFRNDKPPIIALLVILGVVLAVIARIIYDTIFWDATSHNLAPFEIILCGSITTPSAFAGAYLGLLIKKFVK
jgi:uncharacterized membrane protein YccC